MMRRAEDPAFAGAMRAVQESLDAEMRRRV
jgi:hypothetical protein